MKNIVGIALALVGLSLLALGPRVFGPWWAVAGGAAFVLGFVLIMDVAKQRRFTQGLRTDVAASGDTGPTYHRDSEDGGGSGDSGGGHH